MNIFETLRKINRGLSLEADGGIAGVVVAALLLLLLCGA